MSNTSYFEIVIEEGKTKNIDVGQYAPGRSGRNLPDSISLSLQAYRYRPNTTVCALFPPRLIVNAANAFDLSQNLIVNETGSRNVGAVVALNSRTSDSNSSCVDSEVGGFVFDIPIGNRITFPFNISISISDTGVYPEVISYDIDKPVRSPSDASLKSIMYNALFKGELETTNALNIPLVLGHEIFDTSSPPSTTTVHEQIYGLGTTPENFLNQHYSYLAPRTPQQTEATLLQNLSAAIYLLLFGDKSYIASEGTDAYMVLMSDSNNNWLGELMQKGAGLSFFYILEDKIQRIDVIIGDTTEKLSGVGEPLDDLIEKFVTVWDVRILPKTDSLIFPTTQQFPIITSSGMLPIKRGEGGIFAGTFSLNFNY